MEAVDKLGSAERAFWIFVLAAGALVILAAGYLAWLAFYLSWDAPCALSENECSASTSTRVEAVGSLIPGIGAVGCLLVAFGFVGDAVVRADRSRMLRAGRYLLLALALALAWILWLLIFPGDPSDVPRSQT